MALEIPADQLSFSQREVAKITRLSVYRVSRLILTEQLGTMRLGKSRVVSRAALQKFIHETYGTDDRPLLPLMAAAQKAA